MSSELLKLPKFSNYVMKLLLENNILTQALFLTRSILHTFEEGTNHSHKIYIYKWHKGSLVLNRLSMICKRYDQIFEMLLSFELGQVEPNGVHLWMLAYLEAPGFFTDSFQSGRVHGNICIFLLRHFVLF